jgi:hypothetical protein
LLFGESAATTKVRHKQPRYNPDIPMGLENLKTEITADVVDAVWNDNRSIGQRITMGVLGSGFGLFFMYATVFSHGKKPGLLTGILDDPELFNSNVELLWINIIAIILLFAVFGGIAAFGFRCFFCFGDRLHCDHSTFIISKVAFWSFGDRWKVQTVLPFEVSQARYCVVQSGRGGKTYGIRIDIRGKSWKVFYGIDASEAEPILQGLNRMGVNVAPAKK